MATKFLTGSSTMTYIYLMVALLLEIAELPKMIVPLTSPSVVVNKNIYKTSRAYW